MKKSETMDLYEGLNEISPQMIEEAEITRKLPVWISGIKRAIM